MANAAQDEVDRLFRQRDRYTSHPEDRRDSDSDSSSSKDRNGAESESTFPKQTHPGRGHTEDDEDDDNDFTHSFSALATSNKKTYTVPSDKQYSNTGPKGVITDAQHFEQARQSARPRKPTSTQPSTLISKTKYTSSNHDQLQRPKHTSNSDDESNSEEDNDEDEFMREWRRSRLTEMSSHPSTAPSRRKYGIAIPVNGMGYLDAIEQSPPNTTVIVMLYDPHSATSNEVEEEIDEMAQRYPFTRFVKMDHKFAELEVVQIPALLCYRNAEVVETVSGARPGGSLEEKMERLGVLVT